jgi:hypothetical protein
VTFDVDVVLRERDYAVTERIHQAGEPREWTDTEVAAVLREILLAIDRAKNPAATERYVALRGFSWIVNPFEESGVVIAIEIQAGAAVSGPFRIDKKQLEDMISRVIAQAPASSATSIH